MKQERKDLIGSSRNLRELVVNTIASDAGLNADEIEAFTKLGALKFVKGRIESRIDWLGSNGGSEREMEGANLLWATLDNQISNLYATDERYSATSKVDEWETENLYDFEWSEQRIKDRAENWHDLPVSLTEGELETLAFFEEFSALVNQLDDTRTEAFYKKVLDLTSQIFNLDECKSAREKVVAFYQGNS